MSTNNLDNQLEKILTEEELETILDEELEITPAEQSAAEAKKLEVEAHVVDQVEEVEGTPEPKGDGNLNLDNKDMEATDDTKPEGVEGQESVDTPEGKTEPGLNEAEEVPTEDNVTPEESNDEDKEEDSEEPKEEKKEDEDEESLEESFNKLWDLFGLNEMEFEQDPEGEKKILAGENGVGGSVKDETTDTSNSIQTEEVPEGTPEPKGDGSIKQDNSDVIDNEQSVELDKESVTEGALDTLQGPESAAKAQEAKADDTAAPGAGEEKATVVDGNVEASIEVDQAQAKATKLETETEGAAPGAGEEKPSNPVKVGDGESTEKIDETGQLVGPEKQEGSIVGDGSKLFESEEAKEEEKDEEPKEEKKEESKPEEKEDESKEDEAEEKEDLKESEEAEDKEEEEKIDVEAQVNNADNENVIDDEGQLTEAEDKEDESKEEEKEEDSKEDDEDKEEEKEDESKEVEIEVEIKESADEDKEEDKEEKDEAKEEEKDEPKAEEKEEEKEESEDLKEFVEYESIAELLMLESTYFNTESVKTVTPEAKLAKLKEQVALLIAREEGDAGYDRLLDRARSDLRCEFC